MKSLKFVEADKKGYLEINNVTPLGKYYLITGNDFILLKKLQKPSSLDQFDKLSAEVQEQFKELGIKKSDITRAIKWARQK